MIPFKRSQKLQQMHGDINSSWPVAEYLKINPWVLKSKNSPEHIRQNSSLSTGYTENHKKA